MNRYDDRARLVFHYAREEGSRLGHSMIGPEHLLLGLMREGGTAARILQEYGASLEAMRRMVEELVGRGEGERTGEPPAITPRARRVMELASAEARNMGSPVIGTEHILLGIIREGDGIAYRILSHFAKDVDAIRWRVLAMAEGREREKPVNTPFLDEYGRDLTKEAREGKLDPVIGRQEEINRVIQILARHTKNNPVLIGDPGVVLGAPGEEDVGAEEGPKPEAKPGDLQEVKPEEHGVPEEKPLGHQKGQEVAQKNDHQAPVHGGGAEEEALLLQKLAGLGRDGEGPVDHAVGGHRHRQGHGDVRKDPEERGVPVHLLTSS